MEFKCRQCGSCCKRENGVIVIYPEDAKRIADYLSYPVQSFLDRYCEKVRLYIDKNTSLTIYQLDTTNGCVFLTTENLCSIHTVKPLQCKLSPVSYFQSVSTWKNCDQLFHLKDNPFVGQEISDEFFVLKLLEGYD